MIENQGKLVDFLTDAQKRAQFGPCPHCGQMGEFVTNGRWTGPAPKHFGEDGLYVEISADGLCRVSDDRVVRCGRCGHTRRDVEYRDGAIVPKVARK